MPSAAAWSRTSRTGTSPTPRRSSAPKSGSTCLPTPTASSWPGRGSSVNARAARAVHRRAVAESRRSVPPPQARGDGASVSGKDATWFLGHSSPRVTRPSYLGRPPLRFLSALYRWRIRQQTPPVAQSWQVRGPSRITLDRSPSVAQGHFDAAGQRRRPAVTRCYGGPCDVGATRFELATF